jgi:hypothetical protein
VLKRAMRSDIIGSARSYWPCHPDLTVALKLHFVLVWWFTAIIPALGRQSGTTDRDLSNSNNDSKKKKHITKNTPHQNKPHILL